MSLSTTVSRAASQVGTHANRTKHIPGLDLLRFLAALLVLLFHCGLIQRSAVRTGIADPGAFSIAAWTHFGWVGVQIFFVLSGFVIAFSAKSASTSKFFVSRFVRLVPGVWVCAPISLIAVQLTNPAAFDVHLTDAINSVLFNPFGPWIEISYWTLGIEIAFYTVIACLLWFKKPQGIRIFAIVLGLISASYLLLKSTTGFAGDNDVFAFLRWFDNERISALLLIHHGVFFSIGVLLWSLFIDRHESRKSSALFLGVFVIAGCVQVASQCQQYNDIYSTSHPWQVACAWWLGSVFFMIFSVTANVARGPRLASWSAFLALAVYPAYLINFNVGRWILSALLKAQVASIIATIVTVTIVLALSFAIAVWAERPLQRVVRFVLERFFVRVRRMTRRMKLFMWN